MKLYIKEDYFNFKDKFAVNDESGNAIYLVESEFFTFTRRLHIYDLNQKELALIEKQIFSIFSKFKVLINGIEVAKIEEVFSLFKPEFHIKGKQINWIAKGDIFQHNFVISQDDKPIATVKTQLMTFGGCYELEINEGVDPILVLAFVLAIDINKKSARSARRLKS